MYPNCIKKLIECLKDLPGIGEKSAERLAYSIINFDNDKLVTFSDALLDIKNKVHKCSVCGNYTDLDVCSICSDNSRDKNTLFVVEKPKDVVLFEKVGSFHGYYHVLGGLISPINCVNPEDLNIDKLIDRVKLDGVKEVVIVLKPSIEGETTTQYIKKMLESYDVVISKIPIGIPLGTDIEYIDMMTLEMAIDSRNGVI